MTHKLKINAKLTMDYTNGKISIKVSDSYFTV